MNKQDIVMHLVAYDSAIEVNEYLYTYTSPKDLNTSGLLHGDKCMINLFDIDSVNSSNAVLFS